MGRKIPQKHSTNDSDWADTGATLPISVTLWPNFGLLKWRWLSRILGSLCYLMKDKHHECDVGRVFYVAFVKITYHTGDHGGAIVITALGLFPHGRSNSIVARFMMKRAQIFISSVARTTQPSTKIILLAVAELCELRNTHDFWEHQRRLCKFCQIFTPFARSSTITDSACKKLHPNILRRYHYFHLIVL